MASAPSTITPQREVGWVNKKLSEIFDVRSSKRVHKSDWRPEGIPFYRAREIVKLAKTGQVDNDLFISRELFDEFTSKSGAPKSGDLIVSAVGTLGKCYLVQSNDEFYFKDASVLWLKKTSDVDSRFIEYAFQSDLVVDQVMANSMGATVGTYTISRAKNTSIPVPPLPEQERIVGILDEAFEGIAAATAQAEKNLHNARELFQSVLQSTFSQKGDDWEETTLEELTEKITKGSSPKWQGVDYVEEPGVLFVTSENVGSNRMVFHKTKYVEERFNEKDSKSILQRGDVLTNIVGASIGRTAIYDKDEVANINQAVCLIRCSEGKLVNKYLSYLLNSPYFVSILHDNEINNARANLSLGFFRLLTIPIPKLSEQERLISFFDALSEETKALEAIYERKQSALAELKQSLLQKAFAGEL